MVILIISGPDVDVFDRSDCIGCPTECDTISERGCCSLYKRRQKRYIQYLYPSPSCLEDAIAYINKKMLTDGDVIAQLLLYYVYTLCVAKPLYDYD